MGSSLTTASGVNAALLSAETVPAENPGSNEEGVRQDLANISDSVKLSGGAIAGIVLGSIFASVVVIGVAYIVMSPGSDSERF